MYAVDVGSRQCEALEQGRLARSKSAPCGARSDSPTCACTHHVSPGCRALQARSSGPARRTGNRGRGPVMRTVHV